MSHRHPKVPKLWLLILMFIICTTLYMGVLANAMLQLDKQQRKCEITMGMDYRYTVTDGCIKNE